MAHLKLTEQTDAHNLYACENEDSGDDEERAVKRHDVLAGHDFEDQEPGGHSCTDRHSQGSEGAEEVQRARHITKQKSDGEQVEEDAEGARDSVVGLPCRAGRV